MSEAYVHGFNLIVEGARQIRGESCSQVDGAEVSLVTSGEGVPTSALLFVKTAMIEGMILPDVADPESAEFWAGCVIGELRVPGCASCGRRRMPPRTMCPWLPVLRPRWETVSGRGRVWSVVIPHPPLSPAYGDQAPYNVVLVALDEEPSIRSSATWSRRRARR